MFHRPIRREGIKKTSALLVLFLAACTPAFFPSGTSGIQTPISASLTPTAYSTQVFTPLPSQTLTQLSKPTLTPRSEEKINIDQKLEIIEVFLSAQTINGDKVGAVFAPGSFLSLYEQQGGYNTLRLTLQLPHKLIETMTTSEITTLTDGWRVNLYKYQGDNIYQDQASLTMDDLQVTTSADFHSLVAEFSPEDLFDYLGDNRAFTYQVYDEEDRLRRQGAFSIIPYSSTTINWNEFRETLAGGVVHGYPHSRGEDEVAFGREDQHITVQEPQGGFYMLYYIFDLSKATGTTATVELDALAEGIKLELSSKQDDGQLSVEPLLKLKSEGFSVGGIYYVFFPVERIFNQDYAGRLLFLKVFDGDGNLIKKESFRFLPYDMTNTSWRPESLQILTNSSFDTGVGGWDRPYGTLSHTKASFHTGPGAARLTTCDSSGFIEYRGNIGQCIDLTDYLGQWPVIDGDMHMVLGAYLLPGEDLYRATLNGIFIDDNHCGTGHVGSFDIPALEGGDDWVLLIGDAPIPDTAQSIHVFISASGATDTAEVLIDDVRAYASAPGIH